MAEFLIGLGADVNKGEPILGVAFRNRIDMVRLLLDKGANVNATDKDGRSALWMATDDDHEQMMRLLLARGANPSVQSIHGETALMRAAEGHEKAVKLLLQYGADVHPKDWEGKTALDHAYGRMDIRALLIARGAKPGS
jgi:ankyrin repeat protein